MAITAVESGLYCGFITLVGVSFLNQNVERWRDRIGHGKVTVNVDLGPAAVWHDHENLNVGNR